MAKIILWTLLATLTFAQSKGRRPPDSESRRGLRPTAGGISDTTVSVGYEPVQFAVQEAKKYLQALTGSNTEFTLVSIINAKTQVVEGQKLYLTLKMSDNYYCNLTVWYRPWKPTDAERLTVTDGPDCDQTPVSPTRPLPKPGRPVLSKRGAPLDSLRPSVHGSGNDSGGGNGKGNHPWFAMPGGQSLRMSLPSNQTVNEYERSVLEALDFAVCTSDSRHNYPNASVLANTSLSSYTMQVTSGGMTYRFFDVPLVSSGCLNVGCASGDATVCKPTESASLRSCHFQVQVQRWKSPKMKLLDLFCQEPQAGGATDMPRLW